MDTPQPEAGAIAEIDRDPRSLADPAKVQALVNRLGRVGGQVQGIRGMVADGKPCREIAQQLAAARGALDRAYFELMACAIEQSIPAEPDPPDSWRRDVRELVAVLAKYA